MGQCDGIHARGLLKPKFRNEDKNMERRDVLKGMTLAAGAVVAAKEVLTPTEAQAQVTQGRPEGNAMVPMTPVDPDYFIPGRFAGKTIIVTGSARGMGAAAALRLAREGANVVGVDWLKEQGEATHQAILAAGGKSVFVHGDIGEAATAQAAVDQAVAAFGRLDGALNNAGVMDGVFSGEDVDYATQKPLVFARFMRRPRTIGTRYSRPTRRAPFS